MLTRCRGILFAIVLGLICPALIIAVVHKDQQKTIIKATEPTGTIQADRSCLLQITVLMDDGIIEEMNMDDYLTGVVLKEMPANFEIEALKAQAVVARTYALRRKESGGKHAGAAVCTNSDCCQGYHNLQEYLDNGGLAENIQRIKNAVDLTANLVVVYNGELIDATYYSCSGGMTEDAKAVWGADIPYLQSTQSPGEEGAAHYVDTVTFDIEDLLKRLEIKETGVVRIGKISYTSGGGVNTIEVCGREFKGTELRKRLDLRSTAFVVSVVGNTVTITTKGYGHRVGMSQYGADAMAINGAGFPDILAHYYKGTQLVNYNGN